MNEFVISVLIIVSEIMLVLLGIVCIVAFYSIKNNRTTKNQAKEIVLKLNEAESTRKEKRGALLKDKGVADDKLEQNIEKIVENEKTIYRTVIDAILGRNVDSLHEIDKNVEALIESCCAAAAEGQKGSSDENGDMLRLEVDEAAEELKETNATLNADLSRLQNEIEELKSSNKASSNPDDSTLQDEMEELKTKNKALEQELNGIQKESEQVLTEYMSMYDKTEEDKKESSEKEAEKT